MNHHFNPEKLYQCIQLGPRIEPNLMTSIKHALNTQGSFFRANLAYATSREVGLSQTDSDALAISIELFHLSSLILDDLPCMDNSTTRRSHPCTHTLYGDSGAILTSLTLINKGYFLLWKSMHSASEATQNEATSLAEKCLGLEGILNGQALDLKFEQTDRSESTIATIADLKTGSLFRLCLLLPAIIGEVPFNEKQHLEQLAKIWGTTYQIADDVKDLMASETTSGKTPKRDALLNRPNMALTAGISQAQKLLRTQMEQSATAIKTMAKEGGREWACLKTFQKTLAEKIEALLRERIAA
jgi:geranylgeranyl diphosphate synthase type II